GRENLEMVARLFGHDGPGARRAAGAVIDRLGLGEVADRRCATYSGSQRRRLDLGASLVGAPRVLLLDEPTTGLDPAGRREVWGTVRALVAAGTDVVLTTHYLEEADALADQVVVIDRGRAVAAGPVGRLKASVGLDVIEVVVGEADALARAAAVLDGVTGRAARVDRAGRRATVPSTAGTGQLSDVARALDQAGLAVEGVALRRPTLDEVFLALTGGGEAA
ncbi:MAG TPA: ATP-binding cassette domain-containing protein, partial [Acidimicrobiales bacterium]|nr:ATP-binding cassette domain-containing protein [Acidimicrobiales bacterium]